MPLFCLLTLETDMLKLIYDFLRLLVLAGTSQVSRREAVLCRKRYSPTRFGSSWAAHNYNCYSPAAIRLRLFLCVRQSLTGLEKRFELYLEGERSSPKDSFSQQLRRSIKTELLLCAHTVSLNSVQADLQLFSNLRSRCRPQAPFVSLQEYSCLSLSF